MNELTRDAKLIRALLPLMCDDAGRMRAEPVEMSERLLPGDYEAPVLMNGWCDELVYTGFIERYCIDDVDYIRVLDWAEEQKVHHPTPSVLPRSPSEPPEGEKPIRESLRKPQEREPGIKENQPVEARSSAIRESGDFFSGDDEPVVPDRKALIGLFRRLGRKAEADGSHIAAIRAGEMMAKYAGIAPMTADKAAAAAPEERKAQQLPPPEVANGVVPGSGAN